MYKRLMYDSNLGFSPIYGWTFGKGGLFYKLPKMKGSGLKEAEGDDLQERKDKIKKILGKIKSEFELGDEYLYYKNNLILSGDTLITLKNNIKENIERPTTNLKVYIIKFGTFEKNINSEKTVLTIDCTQATITPDLYLKIMSDDYGLTFTFTTDELLKFGYDESYLNKMIYSIKNKMIKSNTMKVPITKLLELKGRDYIEKKDDLQERKDKIKRILGKIENNFKLGYQYLFNKNKPILFGRDLIDLKNSLKTNAQNPTKEHNVSIIDFGILEKNINSKKTVLIINCTPAIITPSLNLKFNDKEYGLTFTFTTDELLKFGYDESYLNKIIYSVKNKMIKSNNMEVSITKLLELFD